MTEASAPAAVRSFAVVGDPVEHSRSPHMHRAAFADFGMPHRYEAVRASPAELAGVVQALRNGKYDGLNVTIPHKRAVLALVDVVDPGAACVGAANTLTRDDEGRLHAHNTDVPGLQLDLRRVAGGELDATTGAALILGSGGVARAAVVALVGLGFGRVVVRARAFAQAEAAQAFREAFLDSSLQEALELEALAPSSVDVRVRCIVQGTSDGMAGATSGFDVARAVAWEHVPADAVVLDTIYAPEETPFLRAARARSLRADNGLGMLAAQGALAFSLWHGVPPPHAVMLAALRS